MPLHDEKTKVELEFQLSEGNCAEVVAKLIKSLRDVSTPRNKSKRRFDHNNSDQRSFGNKNKLVGKRYDDTKKDGGFERRYHDQCDPRDFENGRYNPKLSRRRQSKRRDEANVSDEDREWADIMYDDPPRQRLSVERCRNEELSRRHPLDNYNPSDISEQQGRREDCEDYASLRNNRFENLKNRDESQRENQNCNDGLRNEPFVENRNKRNPSQAVNRNGDCENPKHLDNFDRNEEYGRQKQKDTYHDRNIDRTAPIPFSGYNRNMECQTTTHVENHHAGPKEKDEECTNQGKDTNQARQRQYNTTDDEHPRDVPQGGNFNESLFEGDNLIENFDSICREVKESKKSHKSNKRVSKKERKQKIKDCKRAAKTVLKRCKAQEKRRRKEAKSNMKQFMKDHKIRLKQFKRCMKQKKKEEKMTEKMRKTAAKARIADLKRKLKLECQKLGHGEIGQTGDCCQKPLHNTDINK